MSLTRNEKRLVKKLTAYRKDKSIWGYIKPGKKPNKEDANKFMLNSILDFQMKTEFLGENTRAFVEDYLGNPENLWGVIAAYPLEEWMRIADGHSLHRFPMAKERVHRIACQIVNKYGGDARNIWLGVPAQEVSERLNNLKVGEQISRMILGALYDCKLITGVLDVKADVHVSRVLGRLLTGEPFTPSEAVRQTRRLYPKNPWQLDGMLFDCGKNVCFKENPECHDCRLDKYCEYNMGHAK